MSWILRRLDLPPLWLGLFMALAWIWARIADVVPLGRAWIWPGRALELAGLALIFWAAFWFWRRRTPIEPRHTPTALITDGPFRWTRNPIYRGMLMILAGWTLTEGEATALALVPVYGWVLWTRFAAPEEAVARRAFGAQYDAWADRTRWRL
jgi:protein-S-isoprenylcysteine O-methyltransferase Ste14